MLPFAVAAVEYGALASRGGFARITSDVAEALSSPSPEMVAWIAAGVAIVLLATRKARRAAFVLLVVAAAAVVSKALDLW